MPDYSEFYDARKIITDILHDDLIGPVKKNEILPELPTQYYIMGKLYPQNDEGEVVDLVRNPLLENAAETYDASISLSNQKNPSSFGITCILKPGINSIRLSGSYAFYTLIQYEDAIKRGMDLSKWEALEKKPKDLWIRNEYGFDKVVRLSAEKVEKPVSLDNGIQLQIYTHTVLDSGERVNTVTMINTQQAGKDAVERAQKCAFQPKLMISGEYPCPIFSKSNRQEQFTEDVELLELDLLYSDANCFGQGHGCSVEWDVENEDPLWVSTAWFPSYNLHQMMAADIEDKKVLSMHYLSDGFPKEILVSLRHFANSYNEWIKKIEYASKLLGEKQQNTALNNVQKCKAAFSRIMHSIDLLEKSLSSNADAMKAFQIANEAMLLQRKQSLLKAGKEYDPEKVTWYPFQLAFILHELSSFIEPTGKERDTVDLLWFPTGGGKTEAYLGIAAFVIFLRRLRNSSDDGVTVIMRYTLRLLTLQQFERASMLIFACELLRKEYHLGGTEISIGLWVGGKLTPNLLEEARASINKRQLGAVVSPEVANPCQIQVCPWCGKPLTAKNYSIRIAEKRMLIHCNNEECAFHGTDNGLPLHIIDDAIYEHLPTFIVATVDKFAQIPLSDKPAALFGISSNKKPPELIIQDELHLISGPLGTMTGLYEAAITKLCEKDGIGAKVIASTATIRNARNQIMALYGRDYSQFPPQGISAKDSYFAVESTPTDRPARQYFGVMGIGVTATTTLIRVNAALLFASRYLAGLGYEDGIIDNFWTITGYFNSLRELGGASTQILDDVQSRFSYLAKTKFGHLVPQVDLSVSYDHLVELTSRMDNSEITKIIQDRLKRSYRAGQHKDVYDYVLASNMISVGVDVGRLGVMVVAGQPKTNAEYIQATSRVGRDNPGLVVAVYNPTRSRDRSHYEQFLKYHSALYRYVEATSLTPFADRARDRGLHALYVSLCRYLVPGLLSNNAAVLYDSSNPEVEEIRNLILDYIEKVDPGEKYAAMEELQDIEDAWDIAATGTLVYRSFKNEKKLLKGDTENDRFRTMNSMRSVDAQAGIYLLGR
ncbi:MAG: hypothetical protein IKT09_02650 [Synergistes sp.]|nr:hypothetical protein [Synergistes sp.]